MSTENEPTVHAHVFGGDLWLYLFLTACVVTCGWSPNCVGHDHAKECETEVTP